MNIYDEAIESIEGLPHTMKVPLRRFIKEAQKKDELLELYREYRRLRQLENKTTNQVSALVGTINKIDDLEKALEEEMK